MTTLTEEQKEELQLFAKDMDLEFRSDYSGRGMYGESCIGFVGDISPFDLGLHLATRFQEDSEMLEMFLNDSSKLDNMGLDTILYFPDIQIK